MDLTLADWIAIASIAAPLIAKVATDVAAYLTARHDSALARVVGMAGREAATIAAATAALPADANASTVEHNLIQASAVSVLTEMGSSSKTIGADAGRIAGIITGELNKVKVAPVPVVVAPVAVAPVVTA